jgi:hypothetical protein
LDRLHAQHPQKQPKPVSQFRKKLRDLATISAQFAVEITGIDVEQVALSGFGQKIAKQIEFLRIAQLHALNEYLISIV